jgi:hypothetical protein
MGRIDSLAAVERKKKKRRKKKAGKRQFSVRNSKEDTRQGKWTRTVTARLQ